MATEIVPRENTSFDNDFFFNINPRLAGGGALNATTFSAEL